MNDPTGTTAPAALPFPTWPTLANGQKLCLDAARLQAQALGAMMRYQIETLAFLKHRCEQDAKLVDDLAGSEFNDTFDIVGDFVQNAARDYLSEAGRIASIGSNITAEAAERMRKRADKALEDAAASTLA